MASTLNAGSPYAYFENGKPAGINPPPTAYPPNWTETGRQRAAQPDPLDDATILKLAALAGLGPTQASSPALIGFARAIEAEVTK